MYSFTFTDEFVTENAMAGKIPVNYIGKLWELILLLCITLT